MAKDYFQDIVPPDEGKPTRHARKVSVPHPVEDDDEVEVPTQSDEDDSETSDSAPNPRSIRNITPSKTRLRMTGEREFAAPQLIKLRGGKRWLIWLFAGIALLLVGFFAIFAFRDSTVVVTPRSQPVTFDDSSNFAAYPEGVAATGTLPYKIITLDLEDSEPVAAQGTQHAETKASGSVTVYNDYSTAVVRLVKNTRFESTNGLIFRTPADVVVPGKKGTTPGSINVTVVADKAGTEYNVGPTDFTVPGLKSTAAMYSGVTAKSTADFSGGFIGEQPAVAPATLTAAVSAVRMRLAEKATEAARAQDLITTFPDLIQISYQTLPSTTEAGGGVRIHEKASVRIAAFPKDAFAQTVAKSVSADAENASITLIPGANLDGKSSTPASDWGARPIDFKLSGGATLVWNVDPAALAQALGNKDESAFQTIITGFTGIQEAHARIQPFWKSSFPDSSKIKVQVLSAGATK